MSLSQFPEEPLTLSEKDGFGYFPACVGMLLKKDCYQVLRKLGTGQNSTIWLVSDSQLNPKYYAIKIFTAHATKAHHNGDLLEFEISHAVAGMTFPPNCFSRLYEHFEIDGPHGCHLCLVYRLLGQTVDSFRRSAPSQSLDLPKVQVIIGDVMVALAYLHGQNIMHTNLKADNVMFDEGTCWGSIEELIRKHPQEIYGEFELKGAHYQIMQSRPIPNYFRWNDPPITVEKYNICLAGLSSAQWVGKEPSMRNTSECALRAPEVILGADCGVKVDIGAIGCMAFELLTGRRPFHPEAGETWRVEDDHLSKMMGLTGKKFTDKFLATCQKRDEYFDKTGKLRHTSPLLQMTLGHAMMNHGLQKTDADAAGAFIRTCLHLDPGKRPSAAELLDHP